MGVLSASDFVDVEDVRGGELRQVARHSLERLLSENVRADLATLARDEGSPGGVVEMAPVEMPLLDQLLDATAVSCERGSVGGAGGNSHLPISVDALDLQAEVHLIAGRFLKEYSLHSEWQGLDTRRRLECLLDSLPLLALPQVEAVGNAARLWCQKIVDLLSPSRRTPIDKHCPVCRLKQFKAPAVGYEVEGVYVTRHALHAVWVDERVDRVECASCFSVWQRSQLWEILSDYDRAMLLGELRTGGVAR